MDNELRHHGIKGQKWGIRRFQNKDGTLTAAGKQRAAANHHEDYKRAHEPKSVSSMSDKELKERINRLQMEKQYSQLSPSNVSRGKDYVQKVIKAGTTVATITTTGITIYNNFDKISKIIGKAKK